MKLGICETVLKISYFLLEPVGRQTGQREVKVLKDALVDCLFCPFY